MTEHSETTRPPVPPLQGAVIDALVASGYADLYCVGCEVAGDRVVLHGDVPTWHLKQLAQSVVKRVAGVGCIENRLDVRHTSAARPAAVEVARWTP